jgi:hypothetical protein
MKHYILLPDRTVAQVPDLMEWATWFETADRDVAKTETELHIISTVFLGLDHSFSRKGPPILFETMVFSRDAHPCDLFGRTVEVHESLDCFRYSSWDDAEAGHRATVSRVLKAEADAAKTVKEGFLA